MCDTCHDKSARHSTVSAGRRQFLLAGEGNTASKQKGSARGDVAGNVSRRSVLKAGAGLAIGAGVSHMIGHATAEAQTASRSARTLIIASHPYPERSVVNKALWEVARNAEAVFKNLETAYGDNLRGFDRTAERRLYSEMDRLVLMFPIHWFNLTPMLKAYLNEIWGVGPPPELRGKEMLVVTTAGGEASAYTREGRLGFTIEEVLTPLRASAKYTDMTFSEPLAFLGATGSSTALRQYQDALAARLRVEPRKA
jgi:putative NADPH-quinone reductase